MNLAKAKRCFKVLNKLKDDKKAFSDRKVVLTILQYHMIPKEERTNDDGIVFLIVNAIRKHRGLNYPIYLI